MATVGTPLAGTDVRSVLTTSEAEYAWSDCPRGQITFVPANFAMEWSWSYQSDSVHLTVAPSVFRDFAAEFGSAGPTHLEPRFREMDEGLSYLLSELRKEALGQEVGTDLVTSSLLSLVLARIARTCRVADGTRADPRPVPGFTDNERRRCIEFISDRLHEKFSLAALASEFGYSPFHFARLFKQATGFPPHEYQIRLRIEQARRLLVAHPNMTIAHIALELGFSDESHFRRHFRRITGTTPSKYRASQ